MKMDGERESDGEMGNNDECEQKAERRRKEGALFMFVIGGEGGVEG